ncbi:unnamed protein product, partial [Adineta steineri]
QLVHERFTETVFRVIPYWDIALLILSLIVGFFGAIASSYSSFSDLVNPHSYVKPCWLDPRSADSSNSTLF